MTSDEAVWRGEGWQVRIDSDGSPRGGAVRVRQEQASSPQEARALAAAVAAAATRIDGGPPPLGSGHDAIATDVEGISHGLLVVLIKLGGSIDLDETDLAGDAMGDQEGRLYGVELQPLSSPRVRLAVVNHQSTTQP